MCFLHRLIAALRYFWDGHKAKTPAALSSEGEAWGEALQASLWLGQGLPFGSAFQNVGSFMFLMSP